jgi:hypothetical protein
MPEDDHHHDQDLTTSSKERWEYIGTILAGVMITSLPVLIIGTTAGILTVSTITQGWFVLYATITLMAATWAFGEETLKAVKKARGK